MGLGTGIQFFEPCLVENGLREPVQPLALALVPVQRQAKLTSWSWAEGVDLAPSRAPMENVLCGKAPSMTWRSLTESPCGRQSLGQCDLPTSLGESLEVDREGVEKVGDCYVAGPSQACPWAGDICKDCC